jgi:hypothetical protein
MGKIFIKQNIHYLSISLFLFLFFIITTLKPSFVYNKDGSFKEFGVGYQNKTVIPIWFVVILSSILSYLSVLYIITFSHKIF